MHRRLADTTPKVPSHFAAVVVCPVEFQVAGSPEDFVLGRDVLEGVGAGSDGKQGTSDSRPPRLHFDADLTRHCHLLHEGPFMLRRCDLAIELDEPDRQFRPGDEVSGRITVDVDDDCECRGLEVTLCWKTHGRGTPKSGSEQVETLYVGEWEEESRHSHPFSFRFPNGPYSYRGHYLNVDWYLEAHADIPWSFDPKAECELILQPGDKLPDEPYRTGDPDSHYNRTAEERIDSSNSSIRTLILILAAVFMLPAIGAPVVFLIVALVFFDWNSPLLLPFLAMPFLVAGAVGYFIYTKLLRNRLAERQLGKIKTDVTPRTVHPGDTAGVTVDIPSESETDINEISVELAGTERVRYRRGTKTRTRRHQLFDERHVIPESTDLSLAKGEAAQLHIDIPVPHDVPPSFHAYHNHLLWTVEIHVDVEGWPDWKKKLPLDVVPPWSKHGDHSHSPHSDQTPDPDDQPQAVW